MFGIQTSELIVIALIAILLFGPERVPEFFHRAGRFMSKLQRNADDLWTTLQTEMNQVSKPLEDIGKDIKSIGESLVPPLDASSAADDSTTNTGPESETGESEDQEKPAP